MLVGWNLFFRSEGNQRQRESKVVAKGDAAAEIETLIDAVIEAKSPNGSSINTFQTMVEMSTWTRPNLVIIQLQ